MRIHTLTLAACAFLFAAASVSAHHSFAAELSSGIGAPRDGRDPSER